MSVVSGSVRIAVITPWSGVVLVGVMWRRRVLLDLAVDQGSTFAAEPEGTILYKIDWFERLLFAK